MAQRPPELTRSELENSFLDLVERHGLPRPLVAAELENYTADFLWPHAKLIVETDGLASHGTRTAMERDRRRDRRLLAAGYRTVRLTREALEREESASRTSYARCSVSPDSRLRSSSKPPSRASSSSARAT